MSIEIPLSVKYRPKNLEEIIGQPIVVKGFTNAFKSKTLHHAYILQGQFGCGKTTVARIVAAMENCEKGPAMKPCQTCKNCREIFSGNSIDVKEIDAASNGGVESVRNLKKELSECPINCRTKYVIIDECHSLSREGAEAALKMIEEPPKNVRFIFATTEPHKLKETIHSRCISWKINKVGWKDLVEHLKNIAQSENIQYEEEALKLLAVSSKGSVRNSLQNLQTVINYVGNNNITTTDVAECLGTISEQSYFNLIDAILNEDVQTCYEMSFELLKDGKEAKVVLNGLFEHLRGLLRARLVKSDLEYFYLSEDEKKKYVAQTNKIKKGDFILKMMNSIKEMSQGLDFNLDPQILLEKFCVESVVAKKKFL